jgi:hypothetical protein
MDTQPLNASPHALNDILISIARCGPEKLTSGFWFDQRRSQRSEAAAQQAASNSHLEVCTRILELPAITAQQVRWAVCAAAGCGQLDVLQLLLSKRPDASSPNLKESPLFFAAKSGDTDALQLLFEHGADVNSRKGWPWSAISMRTEHSAYYAAVLHGHPQVLTWLCEHGAHVPFDFCLAVAAARRDGLELIRCLLRCGADASIDGTEAVHNAIFYHRPAALQLLLEAGARIDNKALEAYLQQPFMDIHTLLPYLSPGIKPELLSECLTAAVKGGNVEAVRMLLEAGAPVDPCIVKRLHALAFGPTGTGTELIGQLWRLLAQGVAAGVASH